MADTAMTIKQVAVNFGIPLETLRYYDNSGLFPHLQRNASGYRIFHNVDLSDLRSVICFRTIGMPIADIARVMRKIEAGDEQGKLDELAKQRAKLLAQRDQVDMALLMVQVKQDIYSANDEDVPHTQYLYEEIVAFIAKRAKPGQRQNITALLDQLFQQLSHDEPQTIPGTAIRALVRPESDAAVRDLLLLGQVAGVD
ncbi:MerR family transcriptional regulator [Lacticaseibacillus pabuli]|uniref:MerR family transcriptional regulator n=1 Tax=Lacticaseibacillus pabuli TaxID=3025672 RepID=A0ABY7WSW3_9LACO|nr:MerR family transcriptional regulator [Lacticaseibacillus sp. KACC 23028]WDF83264.1 MerR family transcriptional regulator [Lacticaseibacillus sp. KACC 23028]